MKDNNIKINKRTITYFFITYHLDYPRIKIKFYSAHTRIILFIICLIIKQYSIFKMPQYDQVPCKDTPVGAHFIMQHLSGIAAPSASKPADVSHFQSEPLCLGFSSHP